jgi:hypothetical protein
MLVQGESRFIRVRKMKTSAAGEGDTPRLPQLDGPRHTALTAYFAAHAVAAHERDDVLELAQGSS